MSPAPRQRRPGITIRAGYDRSGLIQASVHNLVRDLIEEAIVVSLVIILFLWHFRSALIPILTIPIAVADRQAHAERQAQPSADGIGTSSPIPPKERRRILLATEQQVGPALFFSLLIIIVSFLPIFLLEAQEGRMFKPLARTKTLAIGFSSILAVTLVPVLMPLFIRGRLRPDARNPVTRFTQALYMPVLRACLRYRKTTLLIALVCLALVVPLAASIVSQFMPALFEGSTLYMPTGIKTPVGMKIQRPSIAGIQQLGERISRLLSGQPGVQSVFAARVAQGFYINIAVNRPVAARYGLDVGEVQRAVESGIGGEDIAQTVEGRARYPVNVHYNRDFFVRDLHAAVPGTALRGRGCDPVLSGVLRADRRPGAATAARLQLQRCSRRRLRRTVRHHRRNRSRDDGVPARGDGPAARPRHPGPAAGHRGDDDQWRGPAPAAGAAAW